MTPRRPWKHPSRDEPASHLKWIPIRECGEPLVDFTALYPELYWVPRHPVFAYRRLTLLREGVARRLAQAAQALPPGLRLAVVEGWRAPAIQARMREATRERLAREHPGWPPATLARMVNRFSAPLDPAAPPPHTTGAAVDVHLVDERGAPLDMVSPYDLLDPRAAPADASQLSPEAARNRQVLGTAMRSAGFTNYPAEWWHWSHGDQAWAYRGGHPEAVYGAIEPDGLADYDAAFEVHEDPGL